MQRKVLLPVLAVLALLIFGMTQTTNADVWNKKTTVTFPEWVEIPGGVVLQPGTYVMKLLDSPANRHIVQVSNERENHVYATILAIPAQRMDPADKTIITFYETPREQPMFIRQWFYPGDTIGQEFVYPKERAMYISQLSDTKVPVAPSDSAAVVTETTTTKTEEVQLAQRQPEPQPEPVEPEPQPVPDPQPVPEPARDASAAPEPSDAEPQEPPPPPRSATPAPATPKEQEPLPQTSTSLPLLGLMAGAFAATAAVVRATRRGRA